MHVDNKRHIMNPCQILHPAAGIAYTVRIFIKRTVNKVSKQDLIYLKETVIQFPFSNQNEIKFRVNNKGNKMPCFWK